MIIAFEYKYSIYFRITNSGVAELIGKADNRTEKSICNASHRQNEVDVEQ
jgi:hypothetical protein